MLTVNVVGLPEFVRCVRAAVRPPGDDVQFEELLLSLSQRHLEPKMREASIRIEGTEIQLWATQDIKLSSGRYRVAWRYDVRDDQPIIVCYMLAAV